MSERRDSQRIEQLTGRELDFPIVSALGTIRSHSAQRITWHSHEGWEILFLIEGATAYEFQRGKTVELTGGHFLLVPPRTAHRGVHEVRLPSSLCGIQFAPWSRAALRHSSLSPAEAQKIRAEFEANALAVRPFNARLRFLLARLMEEADALKAGHADMLAKASLRSLACATLIEAVRQLSRPTRSGSQELIAAAREYLERRHDERIRMPELAAHLRLSRAAMFKLFRSAAGVSPNDYLLRYRVQRAQQLLASTPSASITTVAFAVGFNSSQYFSNVFRKYTGTTPRQYRAAHGGL